MPTINSFIRFLHASPGTPAVDIYLDGDLLFSSIVYNELSNYLVVGPEKTHIQVFTAGEDFSPLLDAQLDIPASSTITIAIIDTPPGIGLLPIFFSVELATDANALIRFVHLSPASPAMDLALRQGNTLFSGVEYTQVTGFQTLSPDVYDLQLQTAGGGEVLAADVLKAMERRAYTVYAIGIPKGDPPLDLFYYQDPIPYLNQLNGRTEFRKVTLSEDKPPRINLVYR